jgi:hypothetical protein
MGRILTLILDKAILTENELFYGSMTDEDLWILIANQVDPEIQCLVLILKTQHFFYCQEFPEHNESYVTKANLKMRYRSLNPPYLKDDHIYDLLNLQSPYQSPLLSEITILKETTYNLCNRPTHVIDPNDFLTII